MKQVYAGSKEDKVMYKNSIRGVFFGLLLVTLAAPAISVQFEYKSSTAVLAVGVEPVVNTISDEVVLKPDTRAASLRKYLESKGSPLAKSANNFVATADEYGLDWRLLPAIAGVESNFGKLQPESSYNPFGWGGGYIHFKSFDKAIRTVGKELWSDTPAKLGPTYCPPNYSQWIAGVEQFMEEIREVEI